MAYELWKTKFESFDGDVELFLKQERKRREGVTDLAISDLVEFGLSQGYSDSQIKGTLEDLLLTFVDEWWLYERVGHPALAAAISADVTLPWLDLDAFGVTIRQRLINRLS